MPPCSGHLHGLAGTAAARGDFVEAALVLERCSMATEEAHMRLRAAEELAGAGRRGEAEEQLRRALAFYRSVGAAFYLRRGESLLAETA